MGEKWRDGEDQCKIRRIERNRGLNNVHGKKFGGESKMANIRRVRGIGKNRRILCTVN